MQPDRLARSKRELDAARLNLGHGFTEQACSHAYYAAFYAVQEALAMGDRTAKTHRGTAQQFGQLLAEMGIATEAGRTFSQLQQLRERTTYHFSQASHEDAAEAIAKSDQVVAAVRQSFEG